MNPKKELLWGLWVKLTVTMASYAADCCQQDDKGNELTGA